MSFLPHRYPFLLVDRIVEIEGDKRIVGLKNVTINEPFFQGHFPGAPVMPGVLIIECMAQVAGVMIYRDMPDKDKKLIYFTGIENAKFRRPVLPGDQLRVEMQLLNRRNNFGKMTRSSDRRREAGGGSDGDVRHHGPPGPGGPMKAHPTAIIHPNAQLACSVTVGPYSLIGENVELGEDCEVMSHCVIEGNTRLGRGNRDLSPTPRSGWFPRT